MCYLLVLISGKLRIMGQARMFSDMDSGGYSFRPGSAQAWFEPGADNAQEWLRQHQLIDPENQPNFRLRQGASDFS